MLNLKPGTLIATIEEFSTKEEIENLINEKVEAKYEGTIETYVFNGSVVSILFRDHEGDIFGLLGIIGNLNLTTESEDEIERTKNTNFEKIGISHPVMFWTITSNPFSKYINKHTKYVNGKEIVKKAVSKKKG